MGSIGVTQRLSVTDNNIKVFQNLMNFRILYCNEEQHNSNFPGT
jgi:hypothetical protein